MIRKIFPATMLVTLGLGIFLLGTGIGHLLDNSWLKGSIFYVLGMLFAVMFISELKGGKVMNWVFRVILRDNRF